jgi:hypothetical protein
MFKSLVSIQEKEEMSVEQTIDSFIFSNEIMSDSMEEMFSVEALGFDIDHLFDLKDTILKHRLSTSLVAFANINNSLSNVVDKFPSLESLSSVNDFYTESQSEAALEGIADTIKTAITGWASKAWATASGFFTGAFTHFTGWLTRFKKLEKESENSQVDSNTFNKVKAHVGGFTYDVYVRAMDFLKSLPGKLKTLWDKELPKSEEEMADYQKAIADARLTKENTTEEKSNESLISMEVSAAGVHEARMIVQNGAALLSKMGFTASNARSILSSLGGFIRTIFSNLLNMSKSIPGWIRKGLSSLTAGAGDAGKYARKAVGQLISVTLASVRRAFTALRGIYTTASSVAESANNKELPAKEPVSTTTPPTDKKE